MLKSASRESYPDDLRSFAVTLSFYSAKAYNYVREKFQLALPPPSIIRKWYSPIDGSPGFTEQAFSSLRTKVMEEKANGRKVFGALMLDEMAIKKHVEYDGKKFYGHVDIGANASGNDLKSEDIASDALVFLVTAVNGSWKVLVAYFLISKLTGSERANLVKLCLSKLHDIGIHIISLTCDGPTVHQSMMVSLGAKLDVDDLQLYFPHPSVDTQRVFVLLDCVHMIKLIQSSFEALSVIYDADGRRIEWRFIKELEVLQTAEGLRAGNKLRRARVHFHKMKMKVNLAVQLLSSSVASAIEFAYQDLHLPQFKGSEATVCFL